MAMLRARGGRSVTTLPSISDVAGGRSLEPGNHAHQRGLAASGWAEQDEKFALLRGQVDAVDGAHLVEMLGQSPCFNNGHDEFDCRSSATSVAKYGFGPSIAVGGPDRCRAPNCRCAIETDQIMLPILPFRPNRLHRGFGLLQGVLGRLRAGRRLGKHRVDDPGVECLVDRGVRIAGIADVRRPIEHVGQAPHICRAAPPSDPWR